MCGPGSDGDVPPRRSVRSKPLARLLCLRCLVLRETRSEDSSDRQGEPRSSATCDAQRQRVSLVFLVLTGRSWLDPLLDPCSACKRRNEQNHRSWSRANVALPVRYPERRRGQVAARCRKGKAGCRRVVMLRLAELKPEHGSKRRARGVVVRNDDGGGANLVSQLCVSPIAHFFDTTGERASELAARRGVVASSHLVHGRSDLTWTASRSEPSCDSDRISGTRQIPGRKFTLRPEHTPAPSIDIAVVPTPAQPSQAKVLLADTEILTSSF